MLKIKKLKMLPSTNSIHQSSTSDGLWVQKNRCKRDVTITQPDTENMNQSHVATSIPVNFCIVELYFWSNTICDVILLICFTAFCLRIIYNPANSNYLQSGCQQIFTKNNSINVFSFQCAYQFTLIFLLVILITWLMNEILLKLFIIRLIDCIISSVLTLAIKSQKHRLYST